MLIEDIPGYALLIREMLKESSAVQFELVHVERLEDGLICLQKETVDVVLLDLHLSDSRGLDTFIRVHAQVPGVPIVILTGFDDETLALEAVRKGAQDYLVKGQVVDSDLLIRSMHYAIGRKRAEEALRASEEKYRELVQNANSIILRRDPEGHITFFNEYAQKFFGYTEDEILGENVVGTIVPETDASGRDLKAMIEDVG
ncbi:MAG: response regulator [Proteobacteria bacterium]|nr:response regulator [Pseudomonadota bacterium]